MPVFVEDPSQLSKARLKSDLIAHNVALPPATSRKGIYVELHTRHVDQKKCADFSSDEDAETDEETNYAEILDPSSLTDDGLKAALLQHGVKAGPIVASTRALYERKLRNLLFSNGHDKVNDKVDEADEAVLYSDSEEEENSEEEEEKPATEEIQTQTEPADQCQEDDTQELSSQGEDYVYPQCFLVSSRQRVCAAKNSKPCPKRNPRNVLKSSHSAQIPSGISRASSIDQPSGLATGLSEQQSILSNGSLISSQNFSITQMVEEMEGRTSCSSLADASDINQSVVQSHWSRSNRPVVKVPFEDKYNSPDLQFYTPMAGFNEWTRKALYRYFTVYLCISYLYLVWCWLILTKFISHFYMHAL
ncbi:LEM domain-containing protein 1 isoform X1 [Boleophthalmus pectinirostris]|uniref:LEM domain-containing protein 1 isoform X1 n=1 Tax=Boleophthalmus pectinirostris TaxID=150288 RepID=UPI002432D939|nr:LEM domain-containing protein 1 isoform X1 [Boleophthalmus pectinirostris]